MWQRRALDELALRVAACVSSVGSWSIPNDSSSSKVLLEELAAILFVQRAIDFPLGSTQIREQFPYTIDYQKNLILQIHNN